MIPEHVRWRTRIAVVSCIDRRVRSPPKGGFSRSEVRQENLNIRGEPIMLQLPLVPAYALTVHKTQALSIKHLVLGCVGLSFTRVWCAARQSVKESAAEGWSCKRDGDIVCYLRCRGGGRERERVHRDRSGGMLRTGPCVRADQPGDRSGNPTKT
jgi:hypothetical protein